MNAGVAPDGSPVDVYLALPPGDTPAIVDSALEPQSSILELGSGPGRITKTLVELGHRVVAVDNSAEMLAHIHDAETVFGDVFTLDLGRTFDAVVAGSHLINAQDLGQRQALLAVCRRHLVREGVTLIERYDPSWAANPKPSHTQIGSVHIVFEPVKLEPGRFQGRVTYMLEDREWTQEFTGTSVTDDMLITEADAAGLRFSGWLNISRTWARLTLADSP